MAEQTWCAQDGPGFFARRPFAGFTVFTAQCPGNNQNFIQALVVADDDNGTNARLLVFPTPYPPNPDAPYDALSNVGWLDGGELTETWSGDTEQATDICRTEGRWKLVGPEPTPQLVFWRDTTDCDGNSGWVVRVGAGATPEPAPLPASPPPEQQASCPAALADVDASFVETQTRLDKAGKADQAEKCAAVRHHIEVMANGINVFQRCLPAGHDKGENIAQLGASIGDFLDVSDSLGCPRFELPKIDAPQ